MLSQLTQRLRQARAQRRLFADDRGAIAASLVEIGVAMLAVGILTAGAFTSFTGFIDSTSNSTARGRLTDGASIADQVYNWLRPGGKRCYSGTECEIQNGKAVASLQEVAGGELTFAEWPPGSSPTFSAPNTIYVQVRAPDGTDTDYAIGNNAATGTMHPNHNGIAGNPADGHWIRLAVLSDSGATFCVIKVSHTDDPVYEGTGYMSINSDNSATSSSSAHCGGHNGGTAATRWKVTAASCVHGSEGASTTTNNNAAVRGNTAMGVTTAPTSVEAACQTQPAMQRPGGGSDVS
ncbi:MAG: hypothetical protein F4Z31_02285 [Gemmatimonadetes bacterium]|nr:hypothetical protein [Gemmatimonadota bacterium]